ncbi:restriction endonuclease subunit S [Paraburkholderia sp. C35]|uniref:restriction endonuclease subunit S n=1 Tax=Paraburkholderia sp. C35 TaxID=2126993 RepID=UPI000D689065|nr:restriction endonuclease subunit S [Paraburkholderia sp. C35]
MSEPVKLRDLVTVPTGTINPKKEPARPFMYVDVASVDNVVKVIREPKELIGADAPSRARMAIRVGDVLVSTVRPNLNAVAMVPESLHDQIASTGFCVLRAREEVSARYLFYFTRSQRFIKGLQALVAGALYPAVTDKQVLDQELPPHSPDEQNRYVELLSRAEHIVRLRADAQQKVADLMPATFAKIFGDPATNPMNWPMTTIGQLLADADYGSSAKAHTDPIGLPMIRMGNVTYEGDLDLNDLKYVELEPDDIERFRLIEGDILFNRTNSKELVGKTGLWDGAMDAIVASYFIRVRVDRAKAYPSYLWAFLNSPHMKRMMFATARGAVGQSNINSKELKAFPIPHPPEGLQKKFDEHCKALLDLAAQQRTSFEKAEATFQALLARAFPG